MHECRQLSLTHFYSRLSLEKNVYSSTTIEISALEKRNGDAGRGVWQIQIFFSYGAFCCWLKFCVSQTCLCSIELIQSAAMQLRYQFYHSRRSMPTMCLLHNFRVIWNTNSNSSIFRFVVNLKRRKMPANIVLIAIIPYW